VGQVQAYSALDKRADEEVRKVVAANLGRGHSAPAVISPPASTAVAKVPAAAPEH